RPEVPSGAPSNVVRVYDELGELHTTMEELSASDARSAEELEAASQALSATVRSLTDGVATQLNASEEAARFVKELTRALREIAQNVEVLASSAEESSAAVL